MVLVYAIVLLGLNILTGYNGQISLGHGAFYAIGAYVAAILMDQSACRTGRRCRSPALCASWSASCSACRRCASRPLSRARDVRARRGDAAAPQVQAHRALDRRRAGHRHRQARPAVRPAAHARPVALLVHARGRDRDVRARLEPAARAGRARAGRDPRPSDRRRGDGHQHRAATSRSRSASARMYTGVAGALGAIAVQFVAPDSFTVVPVDQLPGRHRRRRRSRRSRARSTARCSSSSSPTSPTRSRRRRPGRSTACS